MSAKIVSEVILKARTGYLYKDKKKWVARVTHTDGTGKRRNLKRYADTKTEARLALNKLVRQLEDHGEQLIDGEKLTFATLAERYAAVKLVPAEYSGERKVLGLRSLTTPKVLLAVLVAHFGNKRIRSVKHADLEEFRRIRLQTPTRYKRPRSLTSVNHELRLLGAVFNFAVRNGWLVKSPFKMGGPLINASHEVTRDRVVNAEEEGRLLEAATGHLAMLRPLVVAALDTGMRRGEFAQLEWRDVDFSSRLIRLRAITTKSGKSREMAMTARVETELRRLYEEAPAAPSARVFPTALNDASKRFPQLCQRANVEGLKFHDLRHSFVTRLIEGGLTPALAMRLSGHSTLAMINRYLTVTEDAARQAAGVLERLQERSASAPELIN